MGASHIAEAIRRQPESFVPRTPPPGAGPVTADPFMAIAVRSALAALRLPDDAVMLVCPSDHHIADVTAFRRAAFAAAELAAAGWLVSIGIEAKSPETGFGYLQRGEALGDAGFRTARFVEKPDLERARQFVASGDYAWNGGIFAFGVGTFLRELAAHAPEILAAAKAAVEAGHGEGHLFFPAGGEFARAPSISVDYAVMEPTLHKAMVPADMGWSDIGSWDSLHAAIDCDEQGNAHRGPVELVDCRNVMIDSDGPRVSVIGLEDVVIVIDGDDVLVTSHAGAQKVGKLHGAANQ